MAKIAVEYFQNIFTSSNPGEASINSCLDGMYMVVSNDMNDMLFEDFTSNEVS